MRPEEFVARFRALRGLSQVELARRSGIDHNTVSRILSGKDTKASTLERLARVIEAHERDELARLSELHSIIKTTAAALLVIVGLAGDPMGCSCEWHHACVGLIECRGEG